MAQPDTMSLPMPWRDKKVRLALHLGIASPERPLFRALAGSLDPLDHIRLAADIGFAGITDNGLKLRAPSQQSAMGERLAAAGLVMGSFTNSPMGTRDAFWGDPDSAMDAVFDRAIKESIEAGRRTGGRDITFCALRAEHIAFEVQLDTVARRLRAQADVVARAGMVLAIEPTSATRTPFFLIHHISDARRVMGAQPHPGLSLMFDTAHVEEMDGDPVAAFFVNREVIHTVQIADVAGRVEPGAGRTDFAAIFAALRRDGFPGLVELEHFLTDESAAGERRALDRLAAIVAGV